MKLDYDEDADVLYVAFDRSEHVTGVQIGDNILLRLDTGKVSGLPPRAVGLTFISFRAMMAHHADQPLSVPLANLRHLPRDVWLATVEVLTTPPASDFLGIVLSLSPQSPPLPMTEPQRLSA